MLQMHASTFLQPSLDGQASGEIINYVGLGLTKSSALAFRPLRCRNRNRKLQTSKAPLKSQAQGTAYSRALRQIRGIFQRIVPRRFGRGLVWLSLRVSLLYKIAYRH